MSYFEKFGMFVLKCMGHVGESKVCSESCAWG